MPSGDPTSADSLRPLRRVSLARRAWCNRSLPGELMEIILRGDPDRLLLSSLPLQVKDRCIVARHDSGAGPLLVKRHTWGSAWRTLRMAFREPAARHCAYVGRYLHRRGIPTPLPRAYADNRIGPWTYRSYLVSDYVEGESLYRYIRFGTQTEDELRHVAGQVAAIWSRLVELGISHNDMKPENFIVDRNRVVWLIDLERVRLSGKPSHQRRRQTFDVQNFLHVRGWHHRLEARALFAEAFLGTRYGDWLRSAVEAVSIGGNLQVDTELSVLIVCDDRIDTDLTQRAIDSVRDIADEVVLIDVSVDDGARVVERIEPIAAASKSMRNLRRVRPDEIARHPWVLMLHQNECVTPFLAKEMQQRIADAAAGDAFRIPIEHQYFGRSLKRRRQDVAPIRLVRQSAHRITSVADFSKFNDDQSPAAQLTGIIQSCDYATMAEYIDELNAATTRSAELRTRRGERQRFEPGLRRAIGRFARSIFRRDGILSGRTGLQRAFLEAVFCWVEEVKIDHFAGEFRQDADGGADAGSDAAVSIRLRRDDDSQQSQAA